MQLRIAILASYAPKPPNLLHLGTWVLDQAQALQELGHEVIVISPTPWLPPASNLFPKLRRWYSVPKSEQVEGVPFLYPRFLLYPNVARRLFGIPTILVRGIAQPVLHALEQLHPTIVLAHHPLWEGEFARLFKRKSGVPYVTIEHSWTDVNVALAGSRTAQRYLRVLKEADHWYTVNQAMAKKIMQDKGDRLSIVDSIAKHVLRNGANVVSGVDDIAAECSDSNEGIRILSVGWLGERKGHAILIRAVKEAWERGIPCTLDIIGEGDLRPTLERLIADLGLEQQVRLLGARSHEEVLRRMRFDADVFALLSWEEPFGVVYLEAMAAGLPIIGTYGEGISEVITHGKEGFLVPKGDINAAVEAICALNEPGVARQMGRFARETARQFTWEENARSLDKVFQRVITFQG